MANNHVLTRDIGNLRGFSTDNIFVRPPNVATIALNIQKGADGSMQFRRGYQCQIGNIGGLGIGTFDDPDQNEIQTATVGTDGQLYNKLDEQIYFYYNGEVTGVITNISNANPAVVHSVAHGLQTGAILLIEGVGGMTSVNNKDFTITVIDPDNYSLNGFTSAQTYISGGIWTIAFTQYRYLLFTIFTDPRFLDTSNGWSLSPWSFSPWGAVTTESITANITVYRAAVAVGLQTATNTFNVQFGHQLATGDTFQFIDTTDTFQQRVVTGTTAFSVTFNGFPSSIKDGFYLNQFFDIPFGKGFGVVAPFLISQFISQITDPVTGIFGLKIATTWDTDFPAAFLQIFEPRIIDSNSIFIIHYWLWQQVNHTVPIPFLGFSIPANQNSDEFENASMECYNDVLFIADGYDFPQKYDGQTVYRAGMPQGVRLFDVGDNIVTNPMPFVEGNVYTYAITYQQIDNRGNLVEGSLSDTRMWTTVAATASTNITVTNLLAGSGWNTDCAIANNPGSHINGIVYGPDSNGNYYNTIPVMPGYTLKIGDNAYYEDLNVATITGSYPNPPGTNTFTVNAGHVVEVGFYVHILVDNVAVDATVLAQRTVTQVTPTSITVDGELIGLTIDTPQNISTRLFSEVFGDLAICNGTQVNINTINIVAYPAGFAGILLNDTVSFIDSSGLLQRRHVVALGVNSITIDGIPVSINNLVLIYSENQVPDAINIQRTNFQPAEIHSNAGVAISNGLQINIYRTKEGGLPSDLFYLTTLPNNSFDATRVYTDITADNELGLEFEVKIYEPDPPPVCKYLKVYGTQMLYAGGAVNNQENADNVHFSDGNAPEYVSAARNFFTVPSVDDIVTGVGVAGTTLIITKNQSLWSITGDLLTSQFEVVQIAQGSNIGCAAHATIRPVGALLYFLHTNGVYAISENQLFPTDAFGDPVPISTPIDVIFRETNFLPQTRYVFKRAVAFNYTKDHQYWLFMPCEDIQSTIRTANLNSRIFCYDYQGKNWYEWSNINAAGGMVVIRDRMYFQERRSGGIDGNSANLYKQHRFFRLIDHADHAGSQRIEWRSSWADLGAPRVRKKFSHCVLLMDRVNDLFQFNSPQMYFSSYLDRIPNLQHTIARVTTVDNIRNSSWNSSWGWNFWSGYQDTFITVNLKGGTVAKSIQVGFTVTGINMDMKFSGLQFEAIPDNRNTIAR